MRIKTLTVSGFRSIEEEITVNFGKLTAVIGPNNAGKSNLILAVKKTLAGDWVTANTFEENDVTGRKPEHDIDIDMYNT